MIDHVLQSHRGMYGSPDTTFGIYNFQREEDEGRLVRWLSEGDSPIVIVLAGERGSGRSYLVEAACYRATAEGCPTRVVRLDLDGYEPDRGDDALDRYLKVQLQKNRADTEEKSARLRSALLEGLAVLGLRVSLAAVGLAGLVASVASPVRLVTALRRSRAPGGEPGSDREILSRFLEQQTLTNRLVVHAPNAPAMPWSLRRMLVDMAEYHRDVTIAFSCGLDDRTEEIAPRARAVPRRITLTPLESVEIQAVVDRNFSPNTYPPELAGALHRASSGRTAQLAQVVRRLMATDALRQVHDGTWELAPDGMTAPETVEALAHRLDEPIRVALDELRTDTAHQAREFLEAAALCGPVVPVDLILDFLGVSEEERDDLSDTLDELFFNGGPAPLFADYEYTDPGLRGHAVYRFLSPVLPGVLLARQTLEEQVNRAVDLLRFLVLPDAAGHQRLPPSTRGAAQILVSVAERAGNAEMRESCLHSLAFWVGLADAELMEEQVTKALRRGEIDPEVILRAAQGGNRFWPPYLTAALLSAYGSQDEGIPWDRRLKFYTLRGSALAGMGRYVEARNDATRAVVIGETEKGELSEDLLVALTLLGAIEIGLGQYRAALGTLRRALTNAERLRGSDSFDVAVIAEDTGVVLIMLGEYDDARLQLERALAIEEAVLGPKHPRLTLVLARLGQAMCALGEAGEARQLLERAVTLKRGKDFRSQLELTIALNALSWILREEGNLTEARQVAEEGIMIKEGLLGPEHPELGRELSDLGVIMLEQEELDDAGALLVRALAMLGEDHPAVA